MKGNLHELTTEYVQKIRELSGENDSSFRLFVNCEGFEIEVATREPQQLIDLGISMMNLKGKWIKDGGEK